MNPKLIKTDVDGDVYANACPTIGALMVAHFSTPERHRGDIYGADGLFFTTYQSRRMYLRPAFRGEYDIFTTDEDERIRPMLWVLVSQLAPGHHMILPVWRGRNFWNGPESDSDEGIAAILLQMCLRGGLNLSEWMSFICDQRADKAYKAKQRKSKVTVH